MGLSRQCPAFVKDTESKLYCVDVNGKSAVMKAFILVIAYGHIKHEILQSTFVGTYCLHCSSVLQRQCSL